MHEAVTRSKKKSPEEPDIVAMLVLEGTPYIAETIRSITEPYGIKSTVSSVFCHQKPTVEFNRKQDRCELGDVLIAHRHYNPYGKAISSNSILLQAKMFNGSHYEIPHKEQHQLRLYEHWPRFEYIRSAPWLNGATRDVRPKARHNGAQYLLIDNSFLGSPLSGMLGLPNTHCMAVWPAMSTLYPNNSLADELIRFMIGLTGRPFEDDLSRDPTNWSTVVWDLLEHSLRFVFNRRNVNSTNTSRFGGDTMNSPIPLMNFRTIGDVESPNLSVQEQKELLRERLTNPQRSRHQEPPYYETPATEIPDDSGGVSIILIETKEPERRRG
ncbi:hypothetical protein [Pseudomonas aeruginosa]|uniref:hypothetical protein n=1 Tax=Pseudomonas aeruginosa TaxID=287 RepID=UPI001269B90A|nr:hypothetical protein [Pseudomonas aeruginosa]